MVSNGPWPLRFVFCTLYFVLRTLRLRSLVFELCAKVDAPRPAQSTKYKAQRPKTKDQRPKTKDHYLVFNIHHLPFTIHHLPFTIYHSPNDRKDLGPDCWSWTGGIAGRRVAGQKRSAGSSI